jgi:hypothetical protein
MAKQLDEFPKRSHLGRPRGSKYDKWLDGSVWQLTEQIDFHESPEKFVRGLRQHANTRRGLGLRALIEVDVVTVQAVDKRKRL